MEESILNNTTLWYSVAVVLFVILFARKGWTPIMGWLDGEIAKVRAELDEAKRLHAEAEETLKEYKIKQEEAEKEAARIIDRARKDAVRLREEAERDIKAELERHEALAVNRIKLAEEAALKDVRNYIIEEVIKEVQAKVTDQGAAPKNGELIDNIIADIPKIKSA